MKAAFLTLDSWLPRSANTWHELVARAGDRASLALHVARVRAKVAAGRHDIPVDRIRERYNRSRLNLIQLMPKLA
jgi:hypothetical protein